MFKPEDLLALLPFFIVLGSAIVVILVDAFHRTHQRRTYVAHIASVGMALACAALFGVQWGAPPHDAFGGLFIQDGFTTILSMLFCFSGMITIMIAPRYLHERRAERGEYYALIMLAVTGMMLMAAAGDLIMVFLGIEVMSIAVYVLVGFLRDDKRSTEAAMKYFFLGAFASGVFLYGAALMYGTTGSTNLRDIAQALILSAQRQDNLLVQLASSGAGPTLDPLFTIGMLMVLAGLAFKIALVPFHMWTPDAYEGAPTTSVGFMATAVKAAGFASLIRVVALAYPLPYTTTDAFGWVPVFFALAAITVVVGNLVALTQDSVKRMLAYSSIAHAGYALIGVVSAGYYGNGGGGHASVVFYLVTYTVTTLGAFGVLAVLSRRGREIETYDDLVGLAKSHPWHAFAMGIFMFSSAGIPPSVGFVGKFHVFQMAIVAGGTQENNSFIFLVVIAAMASLAGVYYYLRVIVAMYMRRRETDAIEAPTQSYVTRGALAACAIATLYFGVHPAPLLGYSHNAMSDFNQSASRAPLPPIRVPGVYPVDEKQIPWLLPPVTLGSSDKKLQNAPARP